MMSTRRCFKRRGCVTVESRPRTHVLVIEWSCLPRGRIQFHASCYTSV